MTVILDAEKKCQVFWVGLSAKKIMSDIEIPLSPETNTGMIIHKIEEACEEVIAYKTNLVKCLPLTKQRKLRYPNRNEIDCCFEHLQSEIHIMSPQIVFLLGEKVYSTVAKKMKIKFEKWNGFEYHYKEVEGIYYVPIHHPSYIYVYKRKNDKEVNKMYIHILVLGLILFVVFCIVWKNELLKSLFFTICFILIL